MHQQAADLPERLADTARAVADARERLHEAEEEQDHGLVRRLVQGLKQELKRKEEELRADDEHTDAGTAKAIALVWKFRRLVETAAVGFDIVDKYSNDKAKQDAITSALQDKKIQKLEEFEEKVHTIIAPMLKKMENDLQDMITKLEANSHVALEVKRWKVQSSLRDLKLLIRNLTRGIKVEDGLALCIDRLEEAMTTLINIYERIQTYQDQQVLAEYIADMSSPTANSINITDPTLSSDLRYLDILVKSNLVLQQYNIAVDAFRQWVFPLAHPYLQMIAENVTNLHTAAKDKNMQDLVTEAVKHIETIKLKVDEYKNSVQVQDKYIHNGSFNSKYVSTKPFFVWENDRNKNMIKKLLSGEKVIAKASIKSSSLDKDAIKFNLIEVNLKSTNETIQTELENDLKGFEASITHLGNSYYRYNDKVYVITSDKQEIIYSFEKNDKGEPLQRNNVYIKIRGGDLLLSPYATWEIQLNRSTETLSFDELKKYKDIVDLELVGHGSYLKRGVHESNLMVEDYYTVDETLPEIRIAPADFPDTLNDGAMHSRVRRDQGTHEAQAKSAGSSLLPIGYSLVTWVRCKIAEATSFEQVRKWFVKNESNMKSGMFNSVDLMTENTVSSVTINETKFAGVELDRLYHSTGLGHAMLTEDQKRSSVSRYYDVNVNGILTLADVVARIMTGVRYENTQMAELSHKVLKSFHTDYAHRLMFAAYAPKTKPRAQE